MLSLSQNPPKLSPEQVAASLAAGLQYHHAGRLLEAESCYREILQSDPEHSGALHLLGVLAQQAGQYDLAIELIRAAIHRNPQAADYHNNLANTYRLQDNPSAAIDAYRTATSLDPGHLEALHSLATVLAEQNEFPEAEACLRRVLQLHPVHADALYNLGNLRARQNDLPAAIACYQQALERKPDCPGFHFNLAHALQKSGSLAAATAAYKRCVSLAPDDPEANYNLGIILHLQGELPAAAMAFRLAIALKPHYAEALSNLAAVLQELDDFSETHELLHRAIALNPSLPEAHSNLGGNFWRRGDLAAAIASCRQAIALNPSLPEAYTNLGHIFADQGDLPGALDSYDHALALKPDTGGAAARRAKTWKRGDLLKAFESESPSAGYQQALKSKTKSAEMIHYVGLAHLLRGDFIIGWQNYECRWHTRILRGDLRNFRQPLWRGEPLKGSRILLHAEQGLGDTLQFARYVSMVAARNGVVILEVQPELRSLFAGMAGTSQVIARGDKLPQFTWHCPLLSLPLAFDTELATIPANIPYLQPNPAAVQDWSLHLQGDGLRIGLVWSGNPLHVRDPQRSVPLDQLRPLLEVNRTTFYSLQKGAAANQLLALPLETNLIDLGPQINNFADTAAVISNLDLVISVDTAAAHLAGALGKPVWTLLTYTPDWRWLLNRDDSPWYPTARLFRQPAPGDWSSVIERVVNELQQLAFTPPRRKASHPTPERSA